MLPLLFVTIINKMVIVKSLSVNNLSANGLISPNKRHRKAK